MTEGEHLYIDALALSLALPDVGGVATSTPTQAPTGALLLGCRCSQSCAKVRRVRGKLQISSMRCALKGELSPSQLLSGNDTQRFGAEGAHRKHETRPTNSEHAITGRPETQSCYQYGLPPLLHVPMQNRKRTSWSCDVAPNPLNVETCVAYHGGTRQQSALYVESPKEVPHSRPILRCRCGLGWGPIAVANQASSGPTGSEMRGGLFEQQLASINSRRKACFCLGTLSFRSSPQAARLGATPTESVDFVVISQVKCRGGVQPTLETQIGRFEPPSVFCQSGQRPPAGANIYIEHTYEYELFQRAE
ncbi:hypothetical protein EDB89DRAFT_1909223 [Lactarius sanguifluus]|nr:hypothetical protein EDB89DRAFT_1909223 [Lactarius sanguifluus]